jgi:quercetin dioxygenase-like cupin family protein
MPQRSGPPPHVHPYEDESFWVMEGEMTVEVGGKTLALGPGSLGHVTRNTVHSFKVTSKEVCHILNYYTPAGFEQAIIGSARPAERRELPPPGLDALEFAPGRAILQ